MQKNISKGANYKYNQLFGYKGPNEKIVEEDIISSIKFDKTGNFLALGDRAGRIIIFQCPENNKKKEDYDYFTEFQSHVREFDPLRSMEVQEKIKDINWMKPQGKYMKLVTSNDRSIKLWKIFEKTQKKVVKYSGKQLNMPKLQNVQKSYTSQVQKQFVPKHLTSINSIGCSLNEEYLLSSDQVQTFLWSFQKTNKSFVINDLIKNETLEEVKQNITCSKIHPISDSLFVFGTSKGSLKMCDMRLSALSDNTAVNFKIESPGQKNLLAQMISCYSSAQFTNNAKYLISRDFMTVKIWDICNSKKPVNTIVIQEALKGKLAQLFQNDCLEDKFDISCSSDGNTIFTGSYNNYFHLIDADGTNTQYELNFKKSTLSKQMVPGKAVSIGKMNYDHKVIAGDFNPRKNFMAAASLNCFYIYSM